MVMRFVLVISVILGLFSTCQPTACGSIFGWSGAPIQGEDQTFRPKGSAKFEIVSDVSGSQLKLTLTDMSGPQSASGETLTALLWDIQGQSSGNGLLTPIKAMIATGSSLIGLGATTDMDLSGEWGFKDDIDAGPTQAGPLGIFGVSSVGDVFFGDENPQDSGDSFVPHDRFDVDKNLWGNKSLNGFAGGLVGPGPVPTTNGFQNSGPVVRNEMVFTFNINGTLTEDMIYNVQPLFGTDGAPHLPEPSTLIIWTLLGALGISFGWYRKRRTA